MRKALFLLIVALLILQGCITEYPPINFQDEVEPYKKVYIDLGFNGDTEIALVEFNAINIINGKEKFSARRTIYIYADKYREIHTAGEVETAKLREALREIEDSFNNIGESCSSEFNADLCLDPSSCSIACSQAATICSRSIDEGVGVVLLDYVNHQRKIQNYITALKDILTTESTTVAYGDIAEYVSGLYLEKEILKNHPVNGRILRCNFAYLKSDKFDEIVNDMGMQISPTEYNALVITELKGFDLTNIVDVTMKEKIPSKVKSKINDLSLRREDKVSSGVFFEIEYKTSKLTGNSVQIIPYSARLKPTFDPRVAEEWKNVILLIKFVSYEIPEVQFVLNGLYNIYLFILRLVNLNYFAFSLALFFLVAAISIVWELIKTSYFIITGFKKGRGIKASVELAFGHAKEAPLKKAVKGAALIGVSLAIELTMVNQMRLDSFGVFDIRTFFDENSIELLGVPLYLYGLYIFLEIIKDIVKGIIVGKSYYRNLLESTPKMNRLRLDKLKELIAREKKRLDEFSSKGIDVSEEYDIIVRIPLEELELTVDKEDPYLMRTRLEKYIEEVREISNSLKNKEEIAKKNWPTWKKYLEEEIEKREILNIDTLLLIPHSWRIWAITRYMEENPEEDLVLEGKLIKRKAVSEEDKIKRLISLYLDRNVLAGIIVVKNYKPFAYSSTLPKESIMLNLIMKLFEQMIKFISIFNLKTIPEFRAYSTKYIIGARYKGKYQVVYVALKEKEKELKELFEKLEKM